MIKKNVWFRFSFRGVLPVLFLLLAAVMVLMLVLPATADPVMRYVDMVTGVNTGDCKDPFAPCETINYAIGESADGDTIAVAGGVYAENVKLTDGKSRTIRGGYAYNGVSWLPDSDVTIINGGNVDSTIEIRDHSDTIIENVRVTFGRGVDDPTFGNGCGGFKIQNSDVKIVSAGVRRNNAGTGDGGGICAAGDDGKINLYLDKVFVGGNQAVNSGGGLQLSNTNTTIVNSVIANNRTESGVANAMLLIKDDEVTIINSTISGNNPAGDQAILIKDGKITMKNSIMWNNALNLQADPPCAECFEVTYSDIEQPTAGIGNISEDPLFVNAAARNFRLTKYSPCINAGTADGAPPDDRVGNPRGEYPDMGAFEFVPPDVYLPVIRG